MGAIILAEGNNELNIVLEPRTVGLASVAGAVKDEVTGQPLAGVRVTINGYEAYTNANGSYEISGIIPGTYDIAFSKAGYYPGGWTLSITVTHRISYALYPIS